jgi:hypothetical protein
MTLYFNPIENQLLFNYFVEADSKENLKTAKTIAGNIISSINPLFQIIFFPGLKVQQEQ